MKGKTVVVTGANAGIGKVTAIALGKMGARLVLVCRDKTRGEQAAAEVRQQTGAEVDLVLADFSAQASIRAAAEAIKSKIDRLDVLVNNAGAIIGERKLTEDGYEMTFAVNHLGYFLFTNLLLDLLKKSAPSRIVNVASAVHAQGKIDFDNLNLDTGYSQFAAYSSSKLANILFTNELARRLQGTGVTANSLHPGVVATNFGQSGSKLFAFLTRLGSVFLISPEKGAETSIYLASSPDVEGVTGQYFAKKKAVRPSRRAQSEEDARRLWQVSEKMCGLAAAS